MHKPSLHTEQVWWARQIFLLIIAGLVLLAVAELLEFPTAAQVIAAGPMWLGLAMIPFTPRRKDED